MAENKKDSQDLRPRTDSYGVIKDKVVRPLAFIAPSIGSGLEEAAVAGRKSDVALEDRFFKEVGKLNKDQLVLFKSALTMLAQGKTTLPNGRELKINSVHDATFALQEILGGYEGAKKFNTDPIEKLLLRRYQPDERMNSADGQTMNFRETMGANAQADLKQLATTEDISSAGVYPLVKGDRLIAQSVVKPFGQAWADRASLTGNAGAGFARGGKGTLKATADVAAGTVFPIVNFATDVAGTVLQKGANTAENAYRFVKDVATGSDSSTDPNIFPNRAFGEKGGLGQLLEVDPRGLEASFQMDRDEADLTAEGINTLIGIPSLGTAVAPFAKRLASSREAYRSGSKTAEGIQPSQPKTGGLRIGEKIAEVLPVTAQDVSAYTAPGVMGRDPTLQTRLQGRVPTARAALGYPAERMIPEDPGVDSRGNYRPSIPAPSEMHSAIADFSTTGGSGDISKVAETVYQAVKPDNSNPVWRDHLRNQAKYENDVQIPLSVIQSRLGDLMVEVSTKQGAAKTKEALSSLRSQIQTTVFEHNRVSKRAARLAAEQAKDIINIGNKTNARLQRINQNASKISRGRTRLDEVQTARDNKAFNKAEQNLLTIASKEEAVIFDIQKSMESLKGRSVGLTDSEIEGLLQNVDAEDLAQSTADLIVAKEGGVWTKSAHSKVASAIGHLQRIRKANALREPLELAREQAELLKEKGVDGPQDIVKTKTEALRSNQEAFENRLKTLYDDIEALNKMTDPKTLGEEYIASKMDDKTGKLRANIRTVMGQPSLEAEVVQDLYDGLLAASRDGKTVSLSDMNDLISNARAAQGKAYQRGEMEKEGQELGRKWAQVMRDVKNQAIEEAIKRRHPNDPIGAQAELDDYKKIEQKWYLAVSYLQYLQAGAKSNFSLDNLHGAEKIEFNKRMNDFVNAARNSNTEEAGILNAMAEQGMFNVPGGQLLRNRISHAQFINDATTAIGTGNNTQALYQPKGWSKTPDGQWVVPNMASGSNFEAPSQLGIAHVTNHSTMRGKAMGAAGKALGAVGQAGLSAGTFLFLAPILGPGVSALGTGYLLARGNPHITRHLPQNLGTDYLAKQNARAAYGYIRRAMDRPSEVHPALWGATMAITRALAENPPTIDENGALGVDQKLIENLTAIEDDIKRGTKFNEDGTADRGRKAVNAAYDAQEVTIEAVSDLYRQISEKLESDLDTATTTAARETAPTIDKVKGIAKLTKAEAQAYADQMADKYGIKRDLFRALIEQESSWNPDNPSDKGAVGYGQLMEAAAKDMGVDRFDPKQNIEGAAKYLAKQLRKFNGDESLALSGYNEGPASVAGGDFLGAKTEEGSAYPNINKIIRFWGGTAGEWKRFMEKNAEVAKAMADSSTVFEGDTQAYRKVYANVENMLSTEFGAELNAAGKKLFRDAQTGALKGWTPGALMVEFGTNPDKYIDGDAKDFMDSSVASELIRDALSATRSR